MRSSSTFIAVALVFGAASITATPLSGRQVPGSAKCSPNFAGVGVSVTNSAVEWGASAFEAGAAITSVSQRGPMLMNPDFRFEQTGTPMASYIIKDIGNNGLVVGVSDNTLQLQNINSADITQNWQVQCDFCNPDISQVKGQAAYGCNITSIFTGKCVQIGAASTDPLFLADCNDADSQNFDFWTAYVL